MTKVKQLEKQFGGKWSYNPSTGNWVQQDSLLYVERVCSDAMIDSPPFPPPNYWMYGGAVPVPVFFKDTNKKWFQFHIKPKKESTFLKFDPPSEEIDRFPIHKVFTPKPTPISHYLKLW